MKNAPRYTIGVVSEMLLLHPQTIRQYERLGFIAPSRTTGNKRLYSDKDVKQLEMVISLTKERGINLAGVEIILQLTEKIDDLERHIEMLHAKHPLKSGINVKIVRE